MSQSQRWLRIVSILAVTTVALALRLRAVERLPIDYDEDDYLLAGQHYARAIAAGDWGEIVNYDYNSFSIGSGALSGPATVSAPWAAHRPGGGLDINQRKFKL